ncbi:MAG: nicotinate-nucleotide--dimethylbenzimidazole phosphoribosyltransferase [Puia sp.]|nr:nicotinate-nucleotide--dimethylbenzimidazole phosphoribosyltransferase [Puia sp.]
MELREKIQRKIDNKTKPVGSLGRLEEIALQVGLIQGTDNPQIRDPHIVIFAGDHGIAATGLINPYPQAVTAQMVLNFVRGGAAINVFCRQHRIGLKVVDAGVNADFGHSGGSLAIPSGTPGFIEAKIGYGTRNYLEEEAMSAEEMQKALAKGQTIIEDLFKNGCNCVGLGEMGIGNTSSAALIMSLVTGIPVADCAGRGTGSSDEQLAAKIATLQKVIARHFPGHEMSPATPEKILQSVGGFEIAMMTGAFLKAATLGMVIIVDGFIATSALLLARAMRPAVTDNCIFAHTSGEQGHRKMLDWLGASPVLNLGMRLGEGTGAAMVLPVIRSATAFLDEMASFESAGVDHAG